MKFPLNLLSLLMAACAALLTSCGSQAPKPNPQQTVIKAAQKVNPFPPGSYEHFTFDTYPYTIRTWKNQALLSQATPSNTSIRIDLSKQRGILFVNDRIAMDYRISSGSSKYKTPTGEYTILEKLRDKRSNRYGKMYDSEGKVVDSDAKSSDPVPEGGKFEGAAMPYWMRLTNTGVGMHQGKVGRRYASHGCIRTHYDAVPIVFKKTKIGTPVSVVD